MILLVNDDDDVDDTSTTSNARTAFNNKYIFSHQTHHNMNGQNCLCLDNWLSAKWTPAKYTHQICIHT